MEKQNEHELARITKKVEGLQVRFERGDELLDQLEKVLNGIKESYPFGGEETDAARRMKAIYKEMVARQFPS